MGRSLPSNSTRIGATVASQCGNLLESRRRLVVRQALDLAAQSVGQIVPGTPSRNRQYCCHRLPAAAAAAATASQGYLRSEACMTGDCCRENRCNCPQAKALGGLFSPMGSGGTRAIAGFASHGPAPADTQPCGIRRLFPLGLYCDHPVGRELSVGPARTATAPFLAATTHAQEGTMHSNERLTRFPPKSRADWFDFRLRAQSPSGPRSGASRSAWLRSSFRWPPAANRRRRRDRRAKLKPRSTTGSTPLHPFQPVAGGRAGQVVGGGVETEHFPANACPSRGLRRGLVRVSRALPGNRGQYVAVDGRHQSHRQPHRRVHVRRQRRGWHDHQGGTDLRLLRYPRPVRGGRLPRFVAQAAQSRANACWC